MQEINEAFRVLRDPEERERYDYILSSARTAQTSQPGHEQSDHGTQASSARSEPEQQRNQTYTSPGIPVYCQKCGISNEASRLAVFPYVISIVLVTFRRAWSGVFCSHCSSQKMTIAKLLSFTFGWWGNSVWSGVHAGCALQTKSRCCSTGSKWPIFPGSQRIFWKWAGSPTLTTRSRASLAYQVRSGSRFGLSADFWERPKEIHSDKRRWIGRTLGWRLLLLWPFW